MANLKKENDAIKAKETGQGGLTQGQQTQMARNEQRLEQVGFLSGPGEWCLISMFANQSTVWILAQGFLLV